MLDALELLRTFATAGASTPDDALPSAEIRFVLEALGPLDAESSRGMLAKRLPANSFRIDPFEAPLGRVCI